MSATVVLEIGTCEVLLTDLGFFVRCQRCPYVSETVHGKHTARGLADAHTHEEGSPAGEFAALTISDWTLADQVEAGSECWDIFECVGSAYADWQIQAIDSPEDLAVMPARVLNDDREAWKLVAGTDTPLHRKALAILRNIDPEEYAGMMAWVEESAAAG